MLCNFSVNRYFLQPTCVTRHGQVIHYIPRSFSQWLRSRTILNDTDNFHNKVMMNYLLRLFITTQKDVQCQLVNVGQNHIYCPSRMNQVHNGIADISTRFPSGDFLYESTGQAWSVSCWYSLSRSMAGRSGFDVCTIQINTASPILLALPGHNPALKSDF